MAVFKSSNHAPSLSEIDLNESNDFTCQINTSGESVQAYKIQILSGRGDEVLVDGNANDGKGTNLTIPVKNKGILRVKSDAITDKSKLINGKDYQWGIRTYTAPIGSTAQPKTLVCNGFIVGSTQYVIWVDLNIDSLTIETPSSPDSSYLGGKWEFKDVANGVNASLEGNIKFKSDGVSYTQMVINKTNKSISYQVSGTKTQVYTQENGWVKDAYKTIEIENGQNIYAPLKVFIQTYAEKKSNAKYTDDQIKQKKIEAKDNINNLLQYDRYIEFKIAEENISTQILPFAKEYESNTVYPPVLNSSDGKYYVQRKKINWVEKELGREKRIIKIECEENFDYNFKDGTPFNIYLCSDKHTPNSVYVDPNDIIEPSNYIVIYESKTEYDAAKGDTENANDPTKGIIRNSSRKIMGYSSDTGEIRVSEPFDPVPVNGNYYRIFEYDMIEKKYTEKSGSVAQMIGGSPIENDLFKVYSNNWTGNNNYLANRIFIQPNINIKTDKTNFNEIVFDDGTRLDIKQIIDETTGEDITFEKLDNTQWLLKHKAFTLLKSSGDLYNNLLPKTNYSVYTDFMDSTPYNIFYARETPDLKITYTNLNQISTTIQESITNQVGYRDILFRTIWKYKNDSMPLQEVKYYQYRLYDEDRVLIGKSEELYSTELYGSNGNYKTILNWSFKGLESGKEKDRPRKYNIELVVVDQYGKEFKTSEDFYVYYFIEADVAPLMVSLDCDEKAIKVELATPAYVTSTNDGSYATVDEKDIQADYLDIPKGEVLNYTTIVSDEEKPIIISENMSLLTRFQIKGDFIQEIPSGGELEVIKFASKRYTDKENNIFVIDEYKFTIGSFTTFYVNSNNEFVKNENQFKMKWYKNDEILKCWDKNTLDYADLSFLWNDFLVPENIQSALQNKEDADLYIVQFSEADTKSLTKNNANSKLIQKFKETYADVTLKNGMRILLKETYNTSGEDISSKFLSSGIYKYNNKIWEADLSTEYIFVDNFNSLSNIGITLDDFGIPEDCIGEDGKIFYWYDGETDGNGNVIIDETTNEIATDYIWIENNHLNTKNIETLNKIWFILYFVSNNAVENQYTCILDIENPNK